VDAPATTNPHIPVLVSSIHREVPGRLFDETYLNALKERDGDAENYLILHFSRPVLSKLRVRLRSRELVRDAYQETFLRVFAYFRSGKTLENPNSLPGFVHSISHNVALEFLRAHTRHGQLPENGVEQEDSALSPEGQAVTGERKEFVRRILLELPAKDSQLLRRIFLDEEDKDQVCHEFQIDRDYLRVLLHRARVRFKAALLSQETSEDTHDTRKGPRDGLRGSTRIKTDETNETSDDRRNVARDQASPEGRRSTTAGAPG
jgi:RNA polymerase sigma-70 factor (ECF subfamily)